MKVIGVNGIFTLPGGNNPTTDALLKILKSLGLNIYDFNNEMITLLESYSIKLETQDARNLIKCSWSGDSVIGHSRGALVIHRACTLGAKYNQIYLFNAAIANDLIWPSECANKIINIYNSKDVVLLGGALLPFSRFGLLGRTGYKGIPDKRIEQYNANDYNIKKSFWGHSDCFLNENIHIWANLIKSNLSAVK